MAQKKQQYVLVPAAGLTASEANPKQMQFFQTLHATSLAANKVHSVSSELGALPVVYFQRAVMRYEIGPRIGSAGVKARTVARAAGGISITITSSKGGAPVAGALVVAFTNFAQRAGAQ